MRVQSKRTMVLEMDRSDYMMLLDTLSEASKVRSKLFPSLNEKAAMLYGLITAADIEPRGFAGIVPKPIIEFGEAETEGLSGSNE
jgi:hypothetical protein